MGVFASLQPSTVPHTIRINFTKACDNIFTRLRDTKIYTDDLSFIHIVLLAKLWGFDIVRRKMSFTSWITNVFPERGNRSGTPVIFKGISNVIGNLAFYWTNKIKKTVARKIYNIFACTTAKNQHLVRNNKKKLVRAYKGKLAFTTSP